MTPNSISTDQTNGDTPTYTETKGKLLYIVETTLDELSNIMNDIEDSKKKQKKKKYGSGGKLLKKHDFFNR